MRRVKRRVKKKDDEGNTEKRAAIYIIFFETSRMFEMIFVFHDEICRNFQMIHIEV
jgi:hypothetical protein